MNNETLVLLDDRPGLCWWKDFWSFQPVLFRAVRRCPLLIIYLLASAVLSSITDQFDKLLRIPDGIVMLAMSCTIVHEVWSELSKQPRQPHKEDYQTIASAWGNSICFTIAAGIGLLAFLLPGIYFLTSASLGIVFVCVERMRAARAFDASRKLVKGNFFRSLVYLGSTPLILCLILCAAYFIPIGLASDEIVEGPIGKAMVFVFMLATQWLVLSIVPLQVRLYHQLKEEESQNQLLTDKSNV